MKDIKSVLEYLKQNNKSVRILKKVKRSQLVVIVFEADNQYYIAVFNKKNEIIVVDDVYLRKIEKNQIQERLKDFILTIKHFTEQERKKREIENNNAFVRYKKNGKKIKLKRKKDKTELRYTGKHLDDLLYLWGLLRLTLTYADETGKEVFELKKSNTGYLIMLSKTDLLRDKFIAKLYNRLAKIFRNLGIFDGTNEAKYLDEKFEEYYKLSAKKLKEKNNGKQVYYIDIYLVLYMLQLWKEQVKHKKELLSIDYSIMYKIIVDICEEYQNDEEALDNTHYFVEELYHNTYQKYNWFMKLHK